MKIKAEKDQLQGNNFVLRSIALDSFVTLFLCLTESLSRFEDKASRERTSLENKMKKMEEALE